MGRAVYGGIYEPSHPTANASGFREDVIGLVRRLQVPLIRYPGGNFLSGYDWKDGIGPDRKKRLDLAWGQLEPNSVGVHEFSQWAKDVGADVMMSVNMGAGTPKEAGELVEYCNHKGGSYWSDLRIRNGSKEPFRIRKWCIGNEMDGDWQICSLTAEEYGRKARETAKIMRMVDSNIELVVCGSSAPDMPTYPAWDRRVLELTYDVVDYISLHRYYTYPASENMQDFLTSYRDLDRFIKTVEATADYVKAYRRSNKTMKLSLDEWNIWHTRNLSFFDYDVGNDVNVERWEIGARRLENRYDMADALAFSGMMITMMNNADRVKTGCLAQLVNVIAPVLTQNGGAAICQTIYYPYLYAIRYARGVSLKVLQDCKETESVHGSGQVLHTGCCYDEESEEYNLFVLNTGAEDEVTSICFSDAKLRMIERLEFSM